MNVQIDDSQLQAEANRAGGLPKHIVDVSARSVMYTSLALVARIKTEMPVKSGRARDSWGTPEKEGSWEVSDDGLSVTQGSNVVYVGRLNEGHSQQAPAGFIDAGAEEALDALNDMLLTALEGAL